MTRNEGNLDRALRGIAGIMLIVLALNVEIANPIAYWAAMGIGAVMLITGLTGVCPAYRLFGIKTCRDC